MKSWMGVACEARCIHGTQTPANSGICVCDEGFVILQSNVFGKFSLISDGALLPVTLNALGMDLLSTENANVHLNLDTKEIFAKFQDAHRSLLVKTAVEMANAILPLLCVSAILVC